MVDGVGESVESGISIQTGNLENSDIVNGPQVEWDKTQRLMRRLGVNPDLEMYYEEPDTESRNGWFGGRRIIGRDVPINGGVYLGAGPREALVVDDTKPGNTLNGLYKEFVKRRHKSVMSEEVGFRDGWMEEMMGLVSEVFPIGKEGMERVVQKYGLRPDGKVSLDVFIKERVGVCRHQALLAGYLIERLISEGWLKGGHVSVDRNYVEGMGGHAWPRYTDNDGEVYILDPAIGIPIHMDEENRNIFKFYNRPEEME